MIRNIQTLPSQYSIFLALVFLAQILISGTGSSTDSTLSFPVSTETSDEPVFSNQSKNALLIDFVISFGGLVGLQYERMLTNIVSVECGVTPAFLDKPGVIFPVGIHIFLPFGATHRISANARL